MARWRINDRVVRAGTETPVMRVKEIDPRSSRVLCEWNGGSEDKLFHPDELELALWGRFSDSD